MPLIEGIGDELTITVSVFVIFITLVVAWVSTRVSGNRITNSQLSGLHIELNELTQENTSQSEEEAGSSEENTEVDHEQTLREQSPSDLPTDEDHSVRSGAGAVSGEEGDINEQFSKVESLSTNDVDSNTSESVVRNIQGEESSELCSNTDGGNISNRDTSVDGTSYSERTTNESANSTPTSSDISLKIKFLNETERVVQTSIQETVGNFKRINFAEESHNGRVVHLIFNGQFLRDDNRQLGSYSIVNDCVLHCHISQHQHSPGTAAQQAEQADLDLGQFMVPLFACTIGFVWYLRWQYSYMFNTMSTMSLSAVTVLFMLAVLAAWRG